MWGRQWQAFSLSNRKCLKKGCLLWRINELKDLKICTKLGAASTPSSSRLPSNDSCVVLEESSTFSIWVCSACVTLRYSFLVAKSRQLHSVPMTAPHTSSTLLRFNIISFYRGKLVAWEDLLLWFHSWSQDNMIAEWAGSYGASCGPETPWGTSPRFGQRCLLVMLLWFSCWSHDILTDSEAEHFVDKLQKERKTDLLQVRGSGILRYFKAFHIAHQENHND